MFVFPNSKSTFTGKSSVAKKWKYVEITNEEYKMLLADELVWDENKFKKVVKETNENEKNK